MPPTPDRAAADRAAFERHMVARYGDAYVVAGKTAVLGCLYDLGAMEGTYLAGAEHGRAEATKLHENQVSAHERLLLDRLAATRADLARVEAEAKDAHIRAHDAELELEETRDELRPLKANNADRCDQVEALQHERDRIMVRLGGGCRPELIEDRIRALQAQAGKLARVEAERDEAQRVRLLGPPTLEECKAEFVKVTKRGPCLSSVDFHGIAAVRDLCVLRASPAPRPDEAEALRAKVVEAAREWVGYYSTHSWDDYVNSPGGVKVRCEMVNACAALTRASSPAPSPVEAAAGRLRWHVGKTGPHSAASSEWALVDAKDLRAVLDALGEKGGA